MNEDIRRILDLLDEDLLQGLEGLLVKEEGLKQKDWQGYPDVLMKAEISLRTRGLWEEAGQLIEAVSEQQGDWFGKVQLLRRAMIMYNKIGVELAKQCLIDFQGKETEDGQALRFLKQRREFDVLRGDKDFLAITRELYT